MSQKLLEAGAEVAKAAPPLAVIAATAQGMSLQSWVFVATLVYIGLQAGWLLWKWWRAISTKGWKPEE